MTTTSQQSFSEKHWTTVITPHGSVFHIPWRELWEYRDLIYRFVHRDFVSRYKQTIFGSLWYVLQPLFTSLMFTLVFNKIAKISTGEMPPMLFFLAGTVCWSYFQSCVTQTASTFTSNAGIFDKVYCPQARCSDFAAHFQSHRTCDANGSFPNILCLLFVARSWY
jgi:lipopolysaccharide transport system permease protein